jgi:hypothetical protein
MVDLYRRSAKKRLVGVSTKRAINYLTPTRLKKENSCAVRLPILKLFWLIVICSASPRRKRGGHSRLPRRIRRRLCRTGGQPGQQNRQEHERYNKQSRLQNRSHFRRFVRQILPDRNEQGRRRVQTRADGDATELARTDSRHHQVQSHPQALGPRSDSERASCCSRAQRDRLAESSLCGGSVPHSSDCDSSSFGFCHLRVALARDFVQAKNE